jgi:hypothetical protein
LIARRILPLDRKASREVLSTAGLQTLRPEHRFGPSCCNFDARRSR